MDKEAYATQLAKEMRGKGIKFNKGDAVKLISALTESMSKGLSRDRKLVISNFGTFSVTKYSAKIIQSPRRDNKKFFMPPTDVVKWNPSGKIRQRGVSEEVSDEEYERIKSFAKVVSGLSPIFEETTIKSSEQIPEIKPGNSYEIKINVAGRRRDHLSDSRSPISRLVRSVMREMMSLGAERMEIRPQKMSSEIIYIVAGNESSKKIMPKDSSRAVIEKLRSMADAETQLLLISTENKAKIESKLTPFGEMLIIETA
jgi:nucleoid DNA-binding protein